MCDLDKTPIVDQTKCVKCGQCVRECPYGALKRNQDGCPEVNTEKCRSCGTCQGGCPLTAIAFPGYSTQDALSAIVKASRKSASASSDILVFHCQQVNTDTAQELNGVSFFPVPCAGSVNMSWIYEAVILGFDGVMIVGCNRCKFGTGYKLSLSRVESVHARLSQIFLEKERIKISAVSSESSNLGKDIAQYQTFISTIGPNPLKSI